MDTGALGLLQGFIYLILLVIFYFLPTFIARHRQHHNKNSILVVNLFFGWTLIGWVACLAWSLSKVEQKALQIS